MGSQSIIEEYIDGAYDYNYAKIRRANAYINKLQYQFRKYTQFDILPRDTIYSFFSPIKKLTEKDKLAIDLFFLQLPKTSQNIINSFC